MSVMACDRARCDQIMCARLILDGKYYLCDDCYQELQEARKTGLPLKTTKQDVLNYIEHFMQTPPGTHTEVNLEKEFDRILVGE